MDYTIYTKSFVANQGSFRVPATCVLLKGAALPVSYVHVAINRTGSCCCSIVSAIRAGFRFWVKFWRFFFVKNLYACNWRTFFSKMVCQPAWSFLKLSTLSPYENCDILSSKCSFGSLQSTRRRPHHFLNINVQTPARLILDSSRTYLTRYRSNTAEAGDLGFLAQIYVLENPCHIYIFTWSCAITKICAQSDKTLQTSFKEKLEKLCCPDRHQCATGDVWLARLQVVQIWKKCAFSAHTFCVAMQYEEDSPEKWKTDWIYHSEYQNTILNAAQCIASSVSPQNN